MKIKSFITLVFLCAVILVVSTSAQAQLSETAAWASTLRYRIVPNVTYITANNFDAKLDIYTPQGVAAPVPTLIYIHGGGWVGGNKEGAILNILPYLEMGWAVVNVQYRLCLLYTSPSPRDRTRSRMPSSA